MNTCKLLPVLMLLLVPFASAFADSNLHTSVADSVPTATDLIKLEKIEQRIQYGPHYKNPNAAGRLAVFNRTAPPAPERTKEQLTGPAYKNRKFVSDTNTVTPAPRKRLMGPRYKNRTAKSRRPQ